MITQTINLNLIPGGVLPRIKVSQYDKGSRVLQFNLFNGNSAFTIPVDASITIQGTKADNTGFQYACTFSGSVVTADLEQQMTVFPGDVECEIRISQNLGAVLLGTCNFILDVEEAALQDDIIISETELPLVEKAAEAADAAEASALDAEAWAVGQRDGEDVPADDPAYHNNAKYYAEQVPTLLTNYYTKSETYSKGEVDTALDGKQDTLTFDDSPTSDSSNPVKSGGIYTALAGKVNTEAGKGLSKNDFTDAEKAKVDNAVLWGQANKYIGKNELKVTKTSTTIQNIVYTVYKDSSGRILKINANGTTGASASAFYLNDGFSLETGAKYRLTDGVETHNNKRFLRIGNSTDGFLAGTVDGDNIEFTATETMTARISVEANQTVNVDYYPMIRKTAIADSTYEPYLPSNEEIAEDAVMWEQAEGFVCRNFLPNKMIAGGGQSVTFTPNADGTISLSGTATANVDRPIYDTRDYGVRWSGMKLKVSKGFNNDGITMYVNAYNGTTFKRTLLEVKEDTKDSIVNFDYSDYDRVRVTVYVYNGTNTNDVVVKPMFYDPSETDPEYEQFFESNKTISDIIVPRNLTSSDDLNNVTASGFYTATTSPTNTPEGRTYFSLLVISQIPSESVRQIIFSSNSIYTRALGGSPATWGSWTKYTGTVVS